VTDPYQVPVTFFDEVASFGHADGIGNLVLISLRILPTTSGTKLDPVVCARLRCTLKTAAKLHDALGKMLLAATKTEGAPN
jgi:hypothetical protein